MNSLRGYSLFNHLQLLSSVLEVSRYHNLKLDWSTHQFDSRSFLYFLVFVLYPVFDCALVTSGSRFSVLSLCLVPRIFCLRFLRPQPHHRESQEFASKEVVLEYYFMDLQGPQNISVRKRPDIRTWS